MTIKKKPVVLSWSGGKDSAMVAYHLLASQKYEIIALLTSVTEEINRISMHGVRRELLDRQAAALRIPLHVVMIPEGCPNAVYEQRMGEAYNHFQKLGVSNMAFGDLFLADIKRYRDSALARCGLVGLYPIWQRDTDELVRTFIGLGFKATLCCVDTFAIDAAFAGRDIDNSFLRDLPAGADPCGEHGEYHSFVYDGPIFHHRIACKIGVASLRESRFQFCDILPVEVP